MMIAGYQGVFGEEECSTLLRIFKTIKSACNSEGTKGVKTPLNQDIADDLKGDVYGATGQISRP